MSETTVTMAKLEQLVYFMENVSMPRSQRDEIIRAVMTGILLGNLDPEKIFASVETMPTTNVTDFIRIRQEAGGGKVQASELFCSYVNWCSANAKRPVSIARFGNVLVEMGVRKVKQADANYYEIEPRLAPRSDSDDQR